MIARFRTLPPRRQLAFAALLFVALVGALIAGWLALRTPYAPLFTGLRAPDASAIVAQLDQKHTPYRLGDGGATILVPAEQVDATRLALTSGPLALKGTVGFELFNKSDMGLTEFAQRINYLRALQGELERTILSLDGVAECRVHLSLGEDRLFRENKVRPKASIAVRMRDGARLPAAAAAGVQRLVAAAVPQLDAGDVVILDEHGQLLTTPAQAPDTGSARAIGAALEARIRAALQRATPLGPVAVSVTPDEGRAGDLEAWTGDPVERGFAIAILLDADAAIPAETYETLRAAAMAAVGFDAARGDTIRFGRMLPAVPAAVSPVSPAYAPPPASPQVPEPEPGIAWPWLAVAAALVVALMALVRRRNAPLSAAARQRFSAYLDRLLDEEDRDGAVLG